MTTTTTTPVDLDIVKVHRTGWGDYDAVQLTEENGRDVWEWADSKPFFEPDYTISGLTIFTVDGRVKADFGDWILRGATGRFWPVKPEIFAEHYAPIGDPR